MNQEEFNLKADRFVLGGLLVLVIVGIVVAVFTFSKSTHDAPLAPPSDLKLLSGDPRKDWVVAFHDQRRALTCYVNTQHGGIWCVEDIILEDQLHMLAYRDAGSP